MLELVKSKPKRKQRPAYPLPKSRIVVILALLFGNFLLSVYQPIWFTSPLTGLTSLLYIVTTLILLYGIYRWLRQYNVHCVLYLMIVGWVVLTIHVSSIQPHDICYVYTRRIEGTPLMFVTPGFCNFVLF